MSDAELPNGWSAARVHDVGRVDLGRQRSPENHRGPNMVSYLRVANVFEDRIDLSDVMEMNFSAAEVERFRLLRGDILLNEGQSKELVGRPAMYRDELPGVCFTNSLVRFRAYPVVDPYYALQLFRHYMKSGVFQSIAQITTNIAHLGAGRFADLEFPLPPLKEQRRIVAKLEDLLARSGRAKEALDAIPPLLEKLRQSILAAAFRGDLTADWRANNPDVEPAEKLLERIRAERRKKWEEAELAKMRAKGKAPSDDRWKAKYAEPEPVDARELPELPEGWCWASLEEICPSDAPVVYGIILPGDDQADGVPYIRPIDVAEDGTVKLAELRRCSPEVAAQYARAALRAGDIVLSIVGTIGKVTVVPRELDGANITQSSVRIRPAAGISSQFLAYALLTPQLRAQFDRYRFGNAVQRLNVEHARALAVPLPPAPEQAVIIEKVLNAMQAMPHAVVALLVERRARMDGALLAKAFRGELVPQDPNDEPASVMLERLAAERNAEEKPKRGRAPTKRARA